MDTVRFVLVAVLACVLIQTIAADCEWFCEPLPDGVRCGLRCTFRKRSTGTTYGIPCAFTVYDLDRDGFVTMTELDSVLASVMKNHTIKATFYMMDRNDDAVIDSDEFGDGPLARRNCPQGRTEGQ
ncbi:hypothetical protein KUTeg_015403 [Tegillarca granosa]|uniref:EF-hand domain-containing protein n=1 Tax=Tegillarca granosa TaxID=220873 RepID=A0ABQ9EQM7_TEGGR|nr:hypothetical protein KUTeg_015403 [Tegillarca granosa]